AATAGVAAPVIAGVVGAGGLGLTGATATVTTGMAVGAVSGAVGGGSYAFTTGVLSGKQAGSIVKDVSSSILGGATTGLFTGGLLSGLGGATSGIGNALGRQAADTVIETAVDTVVDAAQGGNISPASIGTSLAINAITEGVSSKTVKGQKGNIAPDFKAIDDTGNISSIAQTVDTVDRVGAVGKIITKMEAGDIAFSDKFSKSHYSSQVSDRGWTNQKIADTINNPVKTTSGYNKYTNSSVTNYYVDDVHYVAVDDSTGKVIQIADLNNPNWKGPQ
ncbi:colicin E5-related ribonuclease, partial [Streptococcus ruminantium]